MRFYWLLLGVLALWRITHLLNAEDGPWDLMVRLRRLAGRSHFGSLLDCFYCLSVWVAAPLAYWLGESWKEAVLLWPALSGGAVLAERLTRKGDAETTQAAMYYTEPEERDELLARPSILGAVDSSAMRLHRESSSSTSVWLAPS